MFVLFSGLGYSFWRDHWGLFSPGPLTAKGKAGITIGGYVSHADIEHECQLCHDPLKTTVQTLCLKCHEEINAQMIKSQGVHGQLPANLQCYDCHPEHKGSEFDPTMAATQYFDHTITNFSLVWHQVNYDTTPFLCSDCHSQDNYSNVGNDKCIECHNSHDLEFMSTHKGNFGENCQGCHDGADAMQQFDHTQTQFILDGKHTEASCIQCHENGKIIGLPHQCGACHSEPVVHQGLFNSECQECHTTSAWAPAILNEQNFDHSTAANFSLALHTNDFQGGNIRCISCHPGNLNEFDIETCISCHTIGDQVFLTAHIEQFSRDCLDCHDGVDRLSNFNHDNYFILDGKHAEILCQDCHIDKVFQGISTDCYQCHAEPEIHMGVFGLACADCHNTSGWTPAELKQHSFPLTHGLSGEAVIPSVDCQICHPAIYIDYTCYGCHEHEQSEMIQKHSEVSFTTTKFEDCAGCHPDGSNVEGKNESDDD